MDASAGSDSDAAGGGGVGGGCGGGDWARGRLSGAWFRDGGWGSTGPS